MSVLGQVEPLSPSDWAQTGVIVVLVMGVLYAGLRGRWMFKWTHDAIVERQREGSDAVLAQLRAEIAAANERERAARQEAGEWKTLALTQAGILETTVQRTTRIVERVTPTSPEGPSDGT